MPLDDPALVVALRKRAQRQAQLLDGVETTDPGQILFQHANKPLGAAVALGFARECRRALDAEEADFGLEVVADILASMIVAEFQARGGDLGEATEALADRLPYRLERFKAIGPLAGVNADALGRAVIHGDEHRGLALTGHDAGQVGAPHHIDPLGGDRAVAAGAPAGACYAAPPLARSPRSPSAAMSQFGLSRRTRAPRGAGHEHGLDVACVGNDGGHRAQLIELGIHVKHSREILKCTGAK